MNYCVKLYNEELLRFSATRSLDGVEIHILSVNTEKENLLPLGMTATDESLSDWLRHRTIPKNRAYVQNFLAKLGLNEKDFIGILDVCRGLSLTDSYWVAREDDTGTFEKYNLFDNKFSTVLSQIAFTGYGSSPKRGFRSSPEFTTNGMLPKAWRRINGKILLYKGGTSGFANTGKEPFSEFYAAQIAEAMGIDHVPYGLARWKGMTCSTCGLFTSKDVAFVPASDIMPTGKMTQIIRYYREQGGSDALADMLVFDAVIRNTDRHLGNFGFLVDSHKNQVIGPAPLFDHGLSLYCYVMDDDLANLHEQENNLTPALYADFDEIAKIVMGPKQREELRRLLTFRFKKHPTYNLPSKRLKMLESAIHRKAQELLKKKNQSFTIKLSKNGNCI